MFRHKHRPSGMEYASCLKCNKDTRAADAAASFFARISPTNDVDPTEVDEAYKLVGALAKLAPKAVREIFDDRKDKRIYAKGRDQLFGPKHEIKLDGPAVHALMVTFAAKLGMAIFRQHVGRSMTRGGVYTQHYFNSGLTKGTAKSILSILPLQGELRQGSVGSGRQFNYRYNTDEKSLVMAFCAFHDNLFIRVLAAEPSDSYKFMLDEYNANFVNFGEVADNAHVWQD